MMNDEDFKILAQQLSCPSGEYGVKTGESMNVTNFNMIRSTLDKLALGDSEKVLEIGPGNASHTNDLLSKGKNIHYTGIDISELMISEAQEINKLAISKNEASFHVSDGKTIAFKDDSFDKIFTVNTVYFWVEPLDYAKEILRVLMPGGTFCLTFAEKDFMETLPFTIYGFQLYSVTDAEVLLSEAGFTDIHAEKKNEKVKSNTGELVDRSFILMTGVKPL